MKNEYRINGNTQKLEVQVETEVLLTLQSMASHTQLSASELANTALKRFIASHKDFLPHNYKKKSA
jgi:hypothetical protein